MRRVEPAGRCAADAALPREAVHAAARGDALIDPNVTVRLIEAFAGAASLMMKVGARSRAELAIWAHERGGRASAKPGP